MSKDELIKLGLTEEQVSKVIEMNSEQLKGFIPKTRFDEVNNVKKSLENDLKDRDKQLENLKKSNTDNEELKSQIEKLQMENKTAQENYLAEVAKIKMNNAIELALKDNNVLNSKAVKALLDLEKVEFKEEKLIGLDEQIEILKKADDSKMLFRTEIDNKPSFAGVQPGMGNIANNQQSNPTIFGALQNLYGTK